MSEISVIQEGIAAVVMQERGEEDLQKKRVREAKVLRGMSNALLNVWGEARVGGVAKPGLVGSRTRSKTALLREETVTTAIKRPPRQKKSVVVGKKSALMKKAVTAKKVVTSRKD